MRWVVALERAAKTRAESMAWLMAQPTILRRWKSSSPHSDSCPFASFVGTSSALPWRNPIHPGSARPGPKRPRTSRQPTSAAQTPAKTSPFR